MILAQTDISGVPAEFVKYFLIMLGFILGGGAGAFAMWRKSRQVSGTQDEPVNLQQPLHIRKVTEHAEKNELQKLSDQLAGLATIVANHYSAQIQSASEREMSIKESVHHAMVEGMREMAKVKDAIKQEIEEKITPITEQLNRLRERVASAETRLDNQKK